MTFNIRSFFKVTAFLVFVITVVFVPKASALVPPPTGAGDLIAFISDAHVQDVVGHPELVRSQEVQVQSTRLFNENYFALCAALDDCGKKGVKLVVMPGDLTDNGQYVNQSAVRDILNKYARKYGFSYFLTFGNHDPARPFGFDFIEKQCLADNGSRFTLSSKPLMDARYMPEYKGATVVEQVDCYRDYGFFPKQEYRLWATPFSSYNLDNYTFEKARSEAIMDHRQYQLNDTLKAYDASYLVEPFDGLWLLALDGSVYYPKGMKDGEIEYGPSEMGYNNVLAGRKHLVKWVAKVVEEAKRQNKTLVTFCHYPLVDYNDGAGEYIARSWGDTKFDLQRTPTKEVTEAFMNAGLQLHLAGHMHVNDTGIKTEGKHTLTNIQVPSTGFFVPAYKILTIKDAKHFDVQTIVLNDVPGFDTLFPLYQKEYDYDVAHGKKPIWSIEALKSKTYPEFCDWQFRDLTRNRFIPRDVPQVLRDNIIDKNGIDILHLIAPKAKGEETMKAWTGFDMLLDMYRLRYAGELARQYIKSDRIAQYEIIFSAARNAKKSNELTEQIRSLGNMFKCFLSEEPSINFSVTLE